MRNAFDFSSWSAAATTLFGLVLVSLVAVGIRLVFMQTLQRRRERENRQINERLRTLIAAYKTLGGSFTGNLMVDPTHWRELRGRDTAAPSIICRCFLRSRQPCPPRCATSMATICRCATRR